MSDKMECPGCESNTWGVLVRFEEGDPCEYCQLPHEAAVAILAARRRSADADLTVQYEQAIIRATRAETELAKIRRIIATVRAVVDGVPEEDR